MKEHHAFQNVLQSKFGLNESDLPIDFYYKIKNTYHRGGKIGLWM